MRLIDADELKAALKNFVYLTEVSQHSDLVEGENIAFKKALELLDNAPTIEAEPIRHGHWETDKEKVSHKCSVCGSCIYVVAEPGEKRIPMYYCDQCGTKMDEEDAE